ncbi:MAG: Hint domain-containing protein, partial [Paracoccaceae bacterium]
QDLPLGVSYFHLLFDDHQIIVSNGIDTESFHPTRRTVTTFAPEVCAELLLIYPELADPGATPRIVVRPLLKPIELRSLVGRSDPHAASKALFRDRPEVADALR